MSDFGYVYAAQIGDFVKIGYAWLPCERLTNLRSEYRCAVTLLGVVEGGHRDELNFHSANSRYAVASELYPKDAAPIVEFLRMVVPYRRPSKGRWPHRPKKWHTPLPAGVIPISRIAFGRSAPVSSQRPSEAADA